MTKANNFIWTEKLTCTFEDIKKNFLSPLVLAHPDPTRPFVLKCDASDFACGAQLLQTGGDGVERSTGFFSAKMTDAQINYLIYNKEMLAIVEALKHWLYLLAGTTTPVII